MSALRIDTESLPLRRRLGPLAWFVLEELALLADGDSVVGAGQGAATATGSPRNPY
ncbi:MAG: hypothetical protein ACR2MO_03640 [Acidimicrobiales bacterium]